MSTIEEKKLFAMMRTTHGMDESTIVKVRNNHVNGVKFPPKLEAHLRTYLDK